MRMRWTGHVYLQCVRNVRSDKLELQTRMGEKEKENKRKETKEK
jgi:hypothetical protein